MDLLDRDLRIMLPLLNAVTDKTIQDAIAALEQQEASIQDEFEKLEARLLQVRAAKSALIALESDEPAEFDGNLADACRLVLRHAGKHSLTPTEVRDALKVLGYDLTKHTNVMASIHSVLKRLAETPDVKSKELRQVPGQRRYYWAANFTEPTETLRIQDTVNASMDAANAVITQRRAQLDRIAARIAASGMTAPPAVLVADAKKKEGKK